MIFVIAFLVGSGVALSIFFVDNAIYGIIGIILVVLAILFGFVLAGYEMDIIKSGIDRQEIAPGIDVKTDLFKGVKAIIVAIVYYFIPAIIAVIVAFLTNLPGNFVNIQDYIFRVALNTNGTAASSSVINVVPQELWASFGTSVTITAIVAIVVFIIFSFIQYMANARLANTDSLGEALNIPEAFRDISRIGYGKVIATIILLVIIVLVINMILSYLYQQVPMLSVLNVFVSPFLMFAMNRANGLLYSDIA